MAESNAARLPSPSAEHRRAAAGQFERANQVIATGNYDYGIRLLLSCCKLDPANLIYRQALRRTEKTKFENNMRGSWLAGIMTWTTRAKIKAVLRNRDFLNVLELGEEVLKHNPWYIGVQMDMAVAADGLALLDLAVWLLEQARQKDPRDANVNRALARLYERRGNFTQAIALWELVRKVAPNDLEAQGKSKDLAASETIARGNYAEAIAGVDAHGEPTGASARSPEPAETRSKPTPPPRSRNDAQRTAMSPAERGAKEVAQLRAKIDADPTNPNIYLQLVGLYRRLNRLDLAREILTEGLPRTSNAFELAIELTELDIEAFRRDLALTEQKLAAAPQDAALQGIRQQLMREINNRELDLYRKRSDRYPTEMSHRFELGVRLLQAGQIDEAIRELQATRSDPRHHWRSLMYLAFCFKGRNNWRLAKRNFEECLQHIPPNEEASRKEVLFQMATGSAEAGDLPAAVELGNELANKDFSYKDIGRLLDEWQSRLQQADA